MKKSAQSTRQPLLRGPLLTSLGLLPFLLASYMAIQTGTTQHSVAWAASVITPSVQTNTQLAQPNAPVTSTTPTVAVSTPTAQPHNISQTVVRLDQASPNQYANESEYSEWWASACSAASMAEVVNAYKGTHYKITDILQVEKSFSHPTVITSDQGLMYNGGIDRTMAYYGFVTAHPQTLDQVIALANAGNPVIVNFPPATFAGGHFLVLVSGNTTSVQLVDSSKLHLGTMSRSRFLSYWRGLAYTFTPTKYSILGAPTITVPFINKVLQAYHSPAQGLGQALYDAAVQYNLDPVTLLAFFWHESSMGTTGEARTTLSLANMRCLDSSYSDLGTQCVNNSNGGACQPGDNCYAAFPSWQKGFVAAARLLAGSLYAGDGLFIPETIVPRWAPSADHNNEPAYIASLKRAFDIWRGGKLLVPNA